MDGFHSVHLLCACNQPIASQQELTISTDSSYAEFLNILSRTFGTQATCFRYQDEEGDEFAVTCDEELRVMLQQYHFMKTHNMLHGPLHVTVVSSRTANARNQLGLTIDVSGGSNFSDDISVDMQDSPLFSAQERPSNNLQASDLTDFLHIGHGQYGAVFRALHMPTNTLMAVKNIEVQATVEEQNFIARELEILHRCQSEHIIKYYGVYFDHSQIHICTEFMNGYSLDKYGRIPERQLATITFGVVQGLNYLSRLKIIHRDVKPNNILLDTAGSVKLCDFGVSRRLEDSYAKTFVGTSAYMAPERIRGHLYDARSETWSLGITLLQLATGRFPYPSTGPARELRPLELLQCIVNEPVPQLPEDEFSPYFVEFVRTCLVKDPMGRMAPSQLLDAPLFVTIGPRSVQELAMFVMAFLQQHQRVE